MEKISEKLKKIQKTPYQEVAEKFSTTELYVGQIARGERKPTRGKGLKIKKELEAIIEQFN